MDNTKAYDNNLKLFYEYQKNKDINIRIQSLWIIVA